MTSYNSELHPKLALWISRWGTAEEEIASEIGITPETFRDWKSAYPEFAKAIGDGREIFASLAEQSMQKLLKGYEVDETFIDADKDGKPLHIKKVTRHIPPNAQAVIFQLKEQAAFKIGRQVAGGGCPSMTCPFDKNTSFLKF